MKQLLAALFLVVNLSTAAQKIDDNTLVKDSAGMVYPAAIWKALLMKGGHSLKRALKDDSTTAYYLVRLNAAEKEAKLARMPQPKESAFFKKGEKFNLGKMKDIEGNKLDLKENGGKITVVNFWFINCPPCRMEIPDLNELVAKYASDSVRFVAVALDGYHDLKEFLKGTPFRYQIVDEGRPLAQRYGVQSYPTHVVVDREGKVAFHTTGLSMNTVYWLEKSIKGLLTPTVETAATQ